jgi:hypothetical protein
LVPTDSICSENVAVKPPPLSTRLSLEFDVPIVRLGGQEITAFALYADRAGASAAPQGDAEHAAKEWLAAGKSQCLRFIEHTQTGDADDIRVDGERVRFTGRVLANLEHDPPWDTATRKIEAKKWNNVIAPADVAKFCGQNIAVTTCRRNVLKQKVDFLGRRSDGEFWADCDFQLYQDACPTEQVFFTIFPLVRTRKGWFDVFTNKEVKKADFEAMCKIRCVGFVPIVLLYVCDATGRAQLASCYIDGLEAPVESIAAEAPVGTEPRELGDLWLRLAVPPEDAARLEERFVLKSADGAFLAEKSASTDHLPDDASADLLFDNLDKGKSYTLEVHRDNEQPLVLFENVPYAELAGLTSDESGQPSNDKEDA